MKVSAKRIGLLRGSEIFLELLERLIQQGKLCCKEIYCIETSYVIEKRAYKYTYPIRIYLAMAYLGFYPKEYRGSFTAYCADRNNAKMDPEYCLKLWKGKIPYVLHKICEVRDKPRKEQKEDMTYFGGRWISKRDLKFWVRL